MSIELSRFKFDDLGFQVCSGEVRDFFHFRIWRETQREQRSFRKTVSSERTLDVDIQVPCPILKVS